MLPSSALEGIRGSMSGTTVAQDEDTVMGESRLQDAPIEQQCTLCGKEARRIKEGKNARRWPEAVGKAEAERASKLLCKFVCPDSPWICVGCYAHKLPSIKKVLGTEPPAKRAKTGGERRPAPCSTVIS